jgi:hypothetical protein
MFRLGAVIIGAAAAATLTGQRRAEAAPPYGCAGLDQCANCSNYPRQGCCCWYVNLIGACRIIMCCDRYNSGLCNTCGTGSNCNCICSYTVCQGCC